MGYMTRKKQSNGKNNDIQTDKRFKKWLEYVNMKKKILIKLQILLEIHEVWKKMKKDIPICKNNIWD